VNPWEICVALIAASKLLNAETIPAVMTQVVELLGHPNDNVRKKAVGALHKFYTVSPDFVSDMTDAFRRALCDRDPSVMAASLGMILDIARKDATPCKTFVSSLVSILKQITEHRLPRDYDYHRMPAPWIQIQILKILALIGKADQKTSEEMYEVLSDVIKRADIGINIGYGAPPLSCASNPPPRARSCHRRVRAHDYGDLP
jgi:AP-4 complex subunit epsilon-1